jgi:hypothetical protein
VPHHTNYLISKNPEKALIYYRTVFWSVKVHRHSWGWKRIKAEITSCQSHDISIIWTVSPIHCSSILESWSRAYKVWNYILSISRYFNYMNSLPIQAAQIWKADPDCNYTLYTSVSAPIYKNKRTKQPQCPTRKNSILQHLSCNCFRNLRKSYWGAKTLLANIPCQIWSSHVWFGTQACRNLLPQGFISLQVAKKVK